MKAETQLDVQASAQVKAWIHLCCMNRFKEKGGSERPADLRQPQRASDGAGPSWVLVALRICRMLMVTADDGTDGLPGPQHRALSEGAASLDLLNTWSERMFSGSFLYHPSCCLYQLSVSKTLQF